MGGGLTISIAASGNFAFGSGSWCASDGFDESSCFAFWGGGKVACFSECAVGVVNGLSELWASTSMGGGLTFTIAASGNIAFGSGSWCASDGFNESSCFAFWGGGKIACFSECAVGVVNGGHFDTGVESS